MQVLKKTVFLRVLAGIASSVAVMAALFYVFLFWNPAQIYHVNLLKWIPILICVCSLAVAGGINRETPVMLLPLLFLPFAVFDLFKFFYVPFIVVLLAVGVLTLVVVRPQPPRSVRLLAALSVAAIFVYFLFSQPLRIELDSARPTADGNPAADANLGAGEDLSVVHTIWDVAGTTRRTLPSHELATRTGDDFNLQRLRGKRHFVTVWATWCAPCLADKPALERLKTEFAQTPSVAFVDLSIDDEQVAWRAYLAEHDPKGRQVIARSPDETRRALRIGALPLHFVVDPQGRYRTFGSFERARAALREAANE